MIRELDAEAATAIWPDVKHFVTMALAHNPTNDISLDDVARQIAKHYAVMLIATDSADDVVGVTVVQLFVLRGRRVLHVLATGGAEVDEWLDELIDYLRDMAQRQEAVAVTMAGRPGWTRKLTGYGFKSEHVTMRMEVDNGRVRKEREQQPEPAVLGELRGPGAGAVPGESQERSADAGIPAARADSGGSAGL